MKPSKRQLFFDSVNIDDIIDQLYPSELYKQFSFQKLLQTFDQERLALIEKKFTFKDQSEGIDIIRFMLIMIPIIKHEQDQIIYLAIGLMELFRVKRNNYHIKQEISEEAKSTKIFMKDITSYVCDYFADDKIENVQIESKIVPIQKQFHPDRQKVREIDIHPPIVQGKSDENLKRFQMKLQTDSIRHNNHSIKQAKYSEELNRIITVDQLSTDLCLYNLDCLLDSRISPKIQTNEKEVVVLDFAWSKCQNRLGMTLKDHSLCFCESNDNFRYQKRFAIASFTGDYQTQIWFLEFNQFWVTTDRSNVLNVWDIEKETLTKRFSNDIIKQQIVDIREIIHLKLVGVASLDKIITIWDFKESLVRLVINLSNGGVHSLIYSYEYQERQFIFHSFQLIFSSGYENRVNAYEIHESLCDYNLKGRFVGHTSMVTAIQIIQKTPHLVSIDDTGNIRLWDIRTVKCLQQLSIGNKANIIKILDISQYGLMAFIGTRLNIMKIDSLNQKNIQNNEFLSCLRAEFDPVELKFIVCTRKDIRYISLRNGRVTRILQGLLNDTEDEISVIKSINQYKEFVLGDSRGNLFIHRYSNSEVVTKLQGHFNEVSFIKSDYENKLLLSAGMDGRIITQKPAPNSTLREVTNVFNSRPITLLECSVYQNVFVAASNLPEIAVFDYELGKLLSIISLHQQEEPTCIQMTKGYPLMFVGTNLGLLYILKYIVKDQSSVQYDILSIGNINSNDVKGNPEEYSNISSEGNNLSYQNHTSIFDLTENQQQKIKLITSNEFNNLYKNNDDYPIKIVPDIEFIQGNKLKHCIIYIGTNQGYLISINIFQLGRILAYNLKSLTEIYQVQYCQNANKRVNYNPMRMGNENYERARQKLQNSQFKLSEMVKQNYCKSCNLKYMKFLDFQAHREQIACLSLVQLQVYHLLSCGTDGYLKLWSLNGENKATVNINHPLPVTWNLNEENKSKFKQQFLYILKILQSLNQMDMSQSERQAIAIEGFLLDLSKSVKKKQLAINDKPIVMRDEYSPRDLKFKEAIKMYHGELMGPSLKVMDANKKMEDLNLQWKIQQVQNLRLMELIR